MEDIERLKAKWRAAVEGMMFFGEPVQDMTAPELRLVIGHLVTENKRLAGETLQLEATQVRLFHQRLMAMGGVPGRISYE
jgi:hypothetical protein